MIESMQPNRPHSTAVDSDRKQELEHHFAENLDSLTYPLLGEIYLTEKDLKRARKVCLVGLKKHPDHAPGWFLLARVALQEGDLKAAERHLRETLLYDRYHAAAAVLLVTIQEKLNRADSTLHRSYRQLIRANPTSRKAQRWLERDKAGAGPKPDSGSVKTDVEVVGQAEDSGAGKGRKSARSKKQRLEEEGKKRKVRAEPQPRMVTPATIHKLTGDYERELKAGLEAESGDSDQTETRKSDFSTKKIQMNPKLATFTLANIYKVQGYYQQALEVLSVLESNGADPERIKSEREAIATLMLEGEDTE